MDYNTPETQLLRECVREAWAVDLSQRNPVINFYFAERGDSLDDFCTDLARIVQPLIDDAAGAKRRHRESLDRLMAFADELTIDRSRAPR